METDYKQILEPIRNYRQPLNRANEKVFIHGNFNLKDFRPSLPLNGKLIRNPKSDWEPIPKTPKIFQQTMKQSEDEYDCILRCRKSVPKK